MKGNYPMPAHSNASLVREAWILACLKDKSLAARLGAALIELDRFSEQLLRIVGIDQRYFRLHDSGDWFTVSGRDPFAYYKAWVEVARAQPRRLFWAPTRLWVFPNWRRAFKRWNAPNLITRPSALGVCMFPPKVSGLAAGTGVADPPGIEGTWWCPAYGSPRELNKSCRQANCRRCWTAPELPVTYKWK